MTSPPSNPPTGRLARLSGRARPGLFLGALVIILLALFLPGTIGAMLVGLIVLAMAWLMAMTWAVTAPRTRAIRVLILLALVSLAWYKATR